jgi:hypothetical protein
MEQLRRHRREEPRCEPDPSIGRAGRAEVEREIESTGDASTVEVIWGAWTDDLDVIGLTVAEVYRLLRQPYRIAPGVNANLNGVRVAPDTRLESGDSLEFVRAAGEKGA